MAPRGIKQGDVFWVDAGVPIGSSPGYLRPYVVIQNDLVNESRIRTVVMCALTTNPYRATDLGNVPLDSGEANLPRQSVVNVSQVLTVDKWELQDKIGTLSPERVREILHGLSLLLEPRDAPA